MTWKDQNHTQYFLVHPMFVRIKQHFLSGYKSELTTIHYNQVLFYRANFGEDPLLAGYTRCIVGSQGTVRCVPPAHINALCIPNLSRYPFDEHVCNLNIGSWVHKGEELDLVLPKKAIITKDLVSNGEWKLEVSNVYKNPGKYESIPKDTFPSIQITFKIQRLPGSHTAGIIIPILGK